MEDERRYLSEGFEVYVILKDGNSYEDLQNDYKTLSVDKASSWDGAFFGHVDTEEAEKFVNDARIDTITEVMKFPRPKKEDLR